MRRGVSPQRPPRKRSGGSRPEAASAGLLVSVVRTLTTSTSEDQREFEKKRLEQGYRETEKTVDLLIGVHKDDLTKCLATFRKLSSDLVDARERVKNVKNNLYSCKSHLQCRRDELRRLWMESAEQKFILQYLHKVEELNGIVKEVEESSKDKHFLQAAVRLRYGLNLVENDFAGVDGVRELKIDLQTKKQETYSEMMEELNKQLYLKPSEELFTHMRGLRGGNRNQSANTIGDLDLPAIASMLELDDELNHGSLRVSLQDSPILQDDGQAYEDTADTKPDAQPVQYMAVLADALALLYQLPEAVDTIRHSVQKGLLKVVHHTTYFVIDYLGGPSGSGDSRHLAELLTLLFRQFKIIATLHSLLIDQFKRVDPTVDVYTVNDVWKSIQSTLQVFLNDYLDVKSTAASIIPETQSISSYFSKKKQPRSTKALQLFRFDATSYAINLAEYARDKQIQAAPTLTTPRSETSETLYVCQRKPDNLVVAFKPLLKLVNEIESHSEGSCILRQYLESYTADTYLAKVQNDVERTLLLNLTSSDAWTKLTSSEETKQLDSSVPLLASSVRLIETCCHLAHLMNSIPTFAEQIAGIFLNLLLGYHHAAREKYETFTKSLIKQEGSNAEIEWRKISAAWAVDEDISRLLKSLPNWLNLMEATKANTPSTPFSPPAPTTPKGHLVHQESTTEIRARNARESEILIGNFSMAKKIEDWEIISNIDQLKFTANMHESIGYFCVSVRRLLADLPPFLQKKLKKSPASAQPGTSVASSGGTLMDEFEAHLMALDDMAATCLLMLHLEVRVHCFYFLLPIAKQTSHMLGGYQSQDVDPQVTSLNRRLVQLDDVLRSSLMPMKVRYVFEGLGHLVSAIFITSSQHIAKMNDNGKKRMGRNILSIQSALSSVTSTRESDLDHARKFFELLFMTPDQILDGILENASEFSELEYTYLLGLSIRSHPTYSTEPGALEKRLARLRDIMSRL